MNIPKVIFIFTVAFLSSINGCHRDDHAVDAESHRKDIEEFRNRRLERLTSETGWLTLAGLHWLSEGRNSFGSDSTNDVVFPRGKAPAHAGTILLDGGKILLESRTGTDLRWHDSVVTRMELRSDGAGSEQPTTLTLGSLIFYVIQRNDQYALRVKDAQNPARLNFKGLEYFPIDLSWHIEARFEPYRPARFIPIESMIGGITQDSCPGALVFSKNGREFRLDAVIEQGSEDRLFIMFFDETNGKETYANGRQLYTDLPDSLGSVMIDFNKAYNWPCVFTPYATCPIPPQQNRLQLRVEAGEKMYHGTGH